MSKKHAFVVYAGATENGRVFYAVVHARQAAARGDQVELYFAGEGTLWPGALAKPSHPMHALFADVKERGIIHGACRNCAAAFGHAETAAAACGLVEGPEASSGQIDILGLEDAGWRVWMF